MTTLEYNEWDKSVRVGTGNRWKDVYQYLEGFGRSAVGSRDGGVGVGGSVLGCAYSAP